MNIIEFEIECPKCVNILTTCFKWTKDKIYCRCCKQIHCIPFPVGYEVCKTCRGKGTSGNRSTGFCNCKSCKGTGLISWTEVTK